MRWIRVLQPLFSITQPQYIPSHVQPCGEELLASAQAAIVSESGQESLSPFDSLTAALQRSFASPRIGRQGLGPSPSEWLQPGPNVYKLPKRYRNAQLDCGQ